MKPTFEQLQPGMQLQIKKLERYWSLAGTTIQIGEILTVVEKNRTSRSVIVSRSTGHTKEMFWSDLRSNSELINAADYVLEAKKPLEVSDIRREDDRIHFTGDGNEFSMGFSKAKSYSFSDECSISIEFNFKNKSGKKKVSTKMLNVLKKTPVFVEYLVEKIHAAVDAEYANLEMDKLTNKRKYKDPMGVWFNGTLDFKNCIYEPCSIEKFKIDFECLVDTFCENSVSFTRTQKLEDRLANS